MPNFELKKFFLSIEKALPDLKHRIACFDADGTLWKNDVDFCFLNYQIQNHLLKKRNCVEKAQEIYLKDHVQSCTLLAQRNEGLSLSDLKKWSHDCFSKNPLYIFPFQREIISFLKKHSTTVYVVTASPQWLVEEAVQFYKLEVDFVIGIKNKVKDGILTNEVELPVSVGKGKVETFLKHSKNQKPFLVSGNTLSDLHLLELSSHLKFVVSSSEKNEPHYESERKLLDRAQKNSWFYTDLINPS